MIFETFNMIQKRNFNGRGFKSEHFLGRPKYDEALPLTKLIKESPLI